MDGLPSRPRPISAAHEVGEMAKACHEVGRDHQDLYTTAFALGCVLKPGESAASPRAKAQAGPMAVVTLHGLIERSIDGLLPPYIQKLAGAYREQYATYQPADAKYLQMHKLHLLKVCARRKKDSSPKTSFARLPSPRPKRCCAIVSKDLRTRATTSSSCSSSPGMRTRSRIGRGSSPRSDALLA